jgi:hypothetical protein
MYAVVGDIFCPGNATKLPHLIAMMCQAVGFRDMTSKKAPNGTPHFYNERNLYGPLEK